MLSKSAYFIGLKGVGMCSLALAMQDAGWSIAGSDTDETFITDDILHARNLGVAPLDSRIPASANLIVHSAAYEPPEKTVKTLSLAQALADFVQDRQVIAVAGVGGKTTTSAMLAAAFHAVGRDVGYYVGTSSIATLPAPGHNGSDPLYIVEADEYAISKTDKRPKFALLTPHILITTNIIHDHPDIYSGETSTLSAFSDLVKRIPRGGAWICNPSDPLTARILSLQGQALKTIKVIQYGSDHPLYSRLKLSVFGDQNRLDALAVVLAMIETGLSQSQALRAIESYRGAGRRQESHGEHLGRLLYDDYGHHPREIELTIQAFKAHFPHRRVLVVFESHTYTRTEALLGEFARSLALADQAFIMPIFESAREKGTPHTVTTESFAALIPGAIPLTWEDAAETIWSASKPGDLILTMGAGFVYKLHSKLRLQ